MSDYGRWPWSWPVEVPITVRTDDGLAHLTTKGTICDFSAHVGSGYHGTWVRDPDPLDSPIGPITLSYQVGRGYLRGKLRSGEWVVVEP